MIKHSPLNLDAANARTKEVGSRRHHQENERKQPRIHATSRPCQPARTVRETETRCCNLDGIFESRQRQPFEVCELAALGKKGINKPKYPSPSPSRCLNPIGLPWSSNLGSDCERFKLGLAERWQRANFRASWDCWHGGVWQSAVERSGWWLRTRVLRYEEWGYGGKRFGGGPFFFCSFHLSLRR